MTQRNSVARVSVAGEELELSSHRAMWWPAEQTLFITDTHFGKAATFRHAGLPVPAGTTERMLARLTQLLDDYAPQRLVVLGDLIHSTTRASRDFENELLAWRRTHSAWRWWLIRGNHDVGRTKLFESLGIELFGEHHQLGPFELCHYPDASQRSSLYRLAGHLHPGVQLPLDGFAKSKLPCFWFGSQTAVLPAFGEFTGLAKVDPDSGDQVYAIVDNEVMRVG